MEAARRIFHSLIGTNIRIYDLNTGLPDRGYYVTKDSPIGDVLFHYSIYEALRSIKSEGRAELLTFPGISLFDTRVKIVEEPGKARVITISTLQHALLLHPLAHIFNVLVSSIGSSFTGMKASNHMWDFYKRLQSHFVPPDDIFSQDTQGPKERFLCSEDWTTATDNFHPQAAQRIILGFGQSMNLPKFYVELCATLLTCERRLFDETGTNYFGIKKKGIMMGDPLTKAVLHLGHLVARKSSENLLRYISLKIPDAGPFIGLQHQGKKYRNIPVYSHKGIQLKGGPLAQAWRTFRLKPENDELSEKEKSRRMLLELSAFGPKSNTKGS